MLSIIHGKKKFARNLYGRLLAWAEYGTPTGEPTLFLHGFPGSHMQAKYYDSTFKELNASNNN